eukprot:CAMPEP_0113624892 /NCGR_PEP_ID=MMETSP0017_2-20120614/12846_1 /TAXON_ID=2856 /ORGANISM="Cylindrotheca closterium" /LENGTH=133 /DNA_ID=CAMNT_0000534965 /DNA_START=789 /DNA_END=1190 /DNA_ORIENTATION=+ /assembly_acc=CAM_ASM_000147
MKDNLDLKSQGRKLKEVLIDCQVVTRIDECKITAIKPSFSCCNEMKRNEMNLDYYFLLDLISKEIICALRKVTHFIRLAVDDRFHDLGLASSELLPTLSTASIQSCGLSALSTIALAQLKVKFSKLEEFLCCI